MPAESWPQREADAAVGIRWSAADVPRALSLSIDPKVRRLLLTFDRGDEPRAR
jgi:hypothetical protein